MEIKNLTPHPIVLDGKIYQSEGSLRVSCEIKKLEDTPIPVSISKFTELEGEVPEEKTGTIYIVSRLVSEAEPKRKDFWIVNETIRDDLGRIIGAKSLTHLHMIDSEIINYLLQKEVEATEDVKFFEITASEAEKYEIENIDVSSLPFKFFYSAKSLWNDNQKHPQKYISSLVKGKDPISKKGIYRKDEEGREVYIPGGFDKNKNKVLKFYDPYNQHAFGGGFYVVIKK